MSHKTTNQSKHKLECMRSEIPSAAPWLPILVIHIRSQVKKRNCQSDKFKKITRNSNFEILHKTLHKTHLLQLLDKMHKYEMNPTRTVGTTERTRDVCVTDGRTDRQTDGRSETNIHPSPQQLHCVLLSKLTTLWHFSKPSSVRSHRKMLK